MLYVHLYYVIKWFYQLKVTQTWLNDTKQPISGKDISIFHPDIHPLSNGPVILHTAKVVGEGILNFDVAISVSLCPGEGFLTVTNWHLAWTGLAYSIAPGVRSDPLKWRAVDSQEISTCLLLYETYFETGNDAHKCVSIETSALQINSKMWHPCGTPIPSASGFAVGFGYLNTKPNRVFGALGIVAFKIQTVLFDSHFPWWPGPQAWNSWPKGFAWPMVVASGWLGREENIQRYAKTTKKVYSSHQNGWFFPFILPTSLEANKVWYGQSKGFWKYRFLRFLFY